MKKFLIATVLLFVFVSPAFALENTPTNPNSTLPFRTTAKLATRSAANVLQTQRIANLQTRAVKEIDRRINSLNELISKINSIKKISFNVKTQLITQIQTEIANLNTLKTKIQSDTTLDTLQTDVKSIITSFRVYAYFMPKITIMVAADKLNQTTENLSSISAKLQTRINEAKSKGMDTANLETLLTDLNNQIANANTQYQTAISQAESLTLPNYTDRSVFFNIRLEIVTGEKDLRAAILDAKKIIEGLKQLKTSPTPTPT